MTYREIFSANIPFALGYDAVESYMRQELDKAVRDGKRLCVILGDNAFNHKAGEPSIDSVRGSYMLIQIPHRVVYRPGDGRPDVVWKSV